MRDPTHDRGAPPSTRPIGPAAAPIACAVACRSMATRLTRRFGDRLRVRHRPIGPTDPPFAETVLVLGVEGFVGAPVALPGRMRAALVREPSEALEVALLLGGADDVIDEARSDALVLARLGALTRRHARGHVMAVRCGPWTLDVVAQSAWRPAPDDASAAGRTVRLTNLEARLLGYLADREGAPASSEELLARVFGYNRRVETHTLETHVYRLRRKLEDEPREPRLIVRCPDGYRLVQLDDGLFGDGPPGPVLPASSINAVASPVPTCVSPIRAGVRSTAQALGTASARQPCARP